MVNTFFTFLSRLPNCIFVPVRYSKAPRVLMLRRPHASSPVTSCVPLSPRTCSVSKHAELQWSSKISNQYFLVFVTSMFGFKAQHSLKLGYSPQISAKPDNPCFCRMFQKSILCASVDAKQSVLLAKGHQTQTSPHHSQMRMTVTFSSVTDGSLWHL